MLLLDLTKRHVMPVQDIRSQSQATTAATAEDNAWAAREPHATAVSKSTVAATQPVGENAGLAARRRQIEWYREQVEKEERRRIAGGVPDYDWDVCMIAHFHDGAPTQLEPAHCTRTHATPHAPHAPCAAQCSLMMATTSPLRRQPKRSACA